ncbi:MAG TPA: hypothetical protein EYO09_04200 [Candidatus Poseidoniales archaeon]|nr:hypothetical protein [Candidatus Poseidoniales archaeon]
MVLSSPTGEISWSTNLSVFSIADPQISFSSITYPDSSTYPQITEGGAHIPGELYYLTWEIENQGDGDWSPIVSLELPTGYNGSCDEVPKVDSGDTESLTCSVEIPVNAMPDMQPQIILTMNGGGLEISDTVSLLIAEVAAVTWSDELLPELETGTQHLVKLRIENTGNSMLSHVIAVDAPDGWEVIIDSGSTISLQAGQSASVRLFVTASTPGLEQCTVRLTNAEAVADSEYTFNLTATGEVKTIVGSSIGEVIMWSSLIIIIVGGILAIVLIMRKEKGGGKSYASGQVNTAQAYGASPLQSGQTVAHLPVQKQPVPQVAPSNISFNWAQRPQQHSSHPSPQSESSVTESLSTESTGTEPPIDEPSEVEETAPTPEPAEDAQSSEGDSKEKESVAVESTDDESTEDGVPEETQPEWPDLGDSDDPWA